MKTSELTGAALDWAVCKAGGGAKDIVIWQEGHSMYEMYHYSTDWAQGGPIIEREGIAVWRPFDKSKGEWKAHYSQTQCEQCGPTPLIAAMRCYVASKLGDEVEIPEELK